MCFRKKSLIFFTGRLFTQVKRKLGDIFTKKYTYCFFCSVKDEKIFNHIKQTTVELQQSNHIQF